MIINIKLYNSDLYLHTLLTKDNINYYLDKLNIYKLTNNGLTYNLKTSYILEDTSSSFDIITDYIPFYSNNYNTFVIRNKNDPTKILTLNEDKTPYGFFILHLDY